MAGLNGVVIRFLADTGQAVAQIGKLERATGRAAGAGKRATAVWSKVGPALATGAIAAGVAVGAAAVKGIQSAIEDEGSQARLAQAMRNLLGATDTQIAAMEDYITVAQKKSGLDDGDLRTGLARLLRSTKDSTRAQSLMNTAQEIAAATGKPLGAVTEALAKFNDGNAGALKRLGITMGPVTRNYAEMLPAVKKLTEAEGLRDQVLKDYGPNSDEYAKAVERVNAALDRVNKIKGAGGVKWLKELNAQFAGSVAAEAGTYGGKITRIGTAYNELLEAFGKGLIQEVSDSNAAFGELDDALYDLQPTAESIGAALGTIAENLASAAVYIGPVADGLQKINDISGGFLLNNIVGIGANTVNMGRRAAAQLTGNAQAAYETGYGRTPQTVAPNATGSANRPWMTNPDYPGSIDPMRYNQRVRDADARARARGARSRGAPTP